jgi:hypothetical protein
VLLQNRLLPIGIPPSHRDDYYSALEFADKGQWDSLVEMLAMLELTTISKTKTIAKEPEVRSAFVERLSKAASSGHENTQHKKYLLWQQRTQQITDYFERTATELDTSSDVLGVLFRDFGTLDYPDWQTICNKGFLPKCWLFSIVFFLNGKGFYKSIAFLRRHNPLPAIDPFALDDKNEIVSLYLTGSGPGERMDFFEYQDSHISLREILYHENELYRYRIAKPDLKVGSEEPINEDRYENQVSAEGWTVDVDTDINTIVEEFFTDVFIRKAGIQL